MLERLVVPVEPAARLSGRGQQSEQHRAKQRIVLARLRAGMGAGEDRSRRFPGELVEGEARVLPRPQNRFAILDERAHERAELVEGGALDRWTCSSNANGSSAPSSSSRPRTTNAPRTKPRKSG